MVKITIREGESIQGALRRLRAEMKKHGIYDEMRKREYYEKPSVVRKREEEQRKRRYEREQRS
jgi:small subunit ribosomal protein S21